MLSLKNPRIDSPDLGDGLHRLLDQPAHREGRQVQHQRGLQPRAEVRDRRVEVPPLARHRVAQQGREAVVDRVDAAEQVLQAGPGPEGGEAQVVLVARARPRSSRRCSPRAPCLLQRERLPDEAALEEDPPLERGSSSRYRIVRSPRRAAGGIASRMLLAGLLLLGGKQPRVRVGARFRDSRTRLEMTTPVSAAAGALIQPFMSASPVNSNIGIEVPQPVAQPRRLLVVLPLDRGPQLPRSPSRSGAAGSRRRQPGSLPAWRGRAAIWERMAGGPLRRPRSIPRSRTCPLAELGQTGPAPGARRWCLPAVLEASAPSIRPASRLVTGSSDSSSRMSPFSCAHSSQMCSSCTLSFWIWRIWMTASFRPQMSHFIVA